MLFSWPAVAHSLPPSFLCASLRQIIVSVSHFKEMMKQRPVANADSNLGRASRNRTLTLDDEERCLLRPRLLPVKRYYEPPCGTMLGDCMAIVDHLPSSFVDLLILDPPYNLTKNFHGNLFKRCDVDSYTGWLDHVVGRLVRLLKPTASVYICGEWFSSLSIFAVASKYFMVRNRITWEREKGRGATTNWKNSSEDIWFCTVSNDFVFNVEAVKLRRKVIAPYKNEDGTPKDWETVRGEAFRDTFPSNIWTDITVPFWSMPENTDHPTQKSEKLLAKIVLASSNENGFILDPFLGSGSSLAVAKKLRRRYLGIDINEEYCLLAEKRLQLAEQKSTIQGLSDGVFWERNSQNLKQEASSPSHETIEQPSLLSA